MNTPLFHDLPIGTRVVFCEYGAYCNKNYTFGIVVKAKHNSTKCRLVESNIQKISDDGIISYEKIIPDWNKPTGVPYIVKKSKTDDLQYLAGHGRASRSMSFIPIFVEVYDDNKEYIDCYDSP